MLLIEILILWAVFFALCFLGTGTDEKNIKNFRSYPDEIQKRLRELEAYRGKFKEVNAGAIWLANFICFALLFLVMGIFIRQGDFTKNFLAILILGQALNIFDLLVIDLLWWRNTRRIRFSQIPEKAPYQNPKKHIESFARAFLMYFIIAIIDGYILTLF